MINAWLLIAAAALSYAAIGGLSYRLMNAWLSSAPPAAGVFWPIVVPVVILVMTLIAVVRSGMAMADRLVTWRQSRKSPPIPRAEVRK